MPYHFRFLLSLHLSISVNFIEPYAQCLYEYLLYTAFTRVQHFHFDFFKKKGYKRLHNICTRKIVKLEVTFWGCVTRNFEVN